MRQKRGQRTISWQVERGIKMKILAIGEAMVEFNQTQGSSDPHYLQGFGGDTSNFLISAARQGAACGYISAVGDDHQGTMLKSVWAAEGIDTKHVQVVKGAHTGIYFVNHLPDGHDFSFYRKDSAASRMTARDLPSFEKTAGFLHLSGISLAISNDFCDLCYAAVDAASASGMTVSLDTNLRLKLWSVHRARAILNDMLSLVDVALPSLEDISAISGLTEPDALVDYCLTKGARIVALKLGARGAIVADARQRYKIPPFSCQPVDATGAGDAFGGAFIARLAAGDGIEEAGRYAAVAAALSTEGYGAVKPIPFRAQVMAAMVRPPDACCPTRL
jgi:2-dehydro-3-deoxygluconokinase